MTQMTPTFPIPTPMIKVFYSSISGLSDARGNELYSSLPQWRKDLTDKITNAKERRRSIAAGALLVRGLHEMGVDPFTAAVSFNSWGKPYLQDIPHVNFSLSHSGEFVMCAVSDEDIGCDIQQISASRISVANRFFTEQEKIQVSSANDLQAEFTRLWTLKESYVKMMGTGISACPLSSFDVSDAARNVNAAFHEHSLPDHYAAVCQKQDTGSVIWQQTDLI